MIRLDASKVEAIVRRLRGSIPVPRDVAHSDVSFWSDGCRLAGNIWRPRAPAATALPGLLLVHGRGDVKEHMNAAYAPRFAALGWVVLTFDYRGWGESEGRMLDEDGGEIREAVNPQANLADIRVAFDFLCGDPMVDESAIAVWGSSLGGRHALQIAIEHRDRVQALVIQAGNLSPARAEGSKNGPARRPRINFAPTEMDDMPARKKPVSKSTSLPANLAQLSAATLIIDAADDEFFDAAQNGARLYESIRRQVRAAYRVIPARHYEIFAGRPYEQAVSLTCKWLSEQVRVPAG